MDSNLILATPILSNGNPFVYYIFPAWEKCMDYLAYIIYPTFVEQGIPLLQGYCT